MTTPQDLKLAPGKLYPLILTWIIINIVLPKCFFTCILRNTFVLIHIDV